MKTLRKKQILEGKNHGFSMVEIIIVIAIMAIIAAALAPSLIKYIGKSRRTDDINNAGEVYKAYERAFIRMSNDHVDNSGDGTSLLRYDMTFNSPAKTLEDYAAEELNGVPEIKAYEDYYWYVEYDTTNNAVQKIYIVDSSSLTEKYEVYPDGDDYLESKNK